jgi:hypothetical protein
MTVSMKALKSFVYAGKRLHRGDEFQARGRLGRPGSDATVLQAIGNAAPAPAPRIIPTPVYATRAMVAAPAAPAVVEGDDLHALDRDALHALAAKLGVKVHHMAGAAKVRQAILDARAA